MILGVVLLASKIFLPDLNPSFGINLIVSYGADIRVGFVEFSGLTMETWVEWVYWDYFALYIPWISQETINDEETIQKSKHSVLGDEYEEEAFEVKPVAAVNDSLPELFDHGFINTTVDNIEFEFNVKYFDANFEGPDPDYGVRLYLIAPNGTALEYLEMDIKNGEPDYSDISGVVFNYTIDISNFEDGLWHYYFITKDNSTGEKVFYPKDCYFIGPFTSDYDKSAFLFGPRVANTNSTYNRPEGWITDEFFFHIYWWDLINSSAPLNISLCLAPAVVLEGEGISKNKGIQKFEMQPVDSTPNYTLFVEYYTVINFTDLGYTDSDVGMFYHYFEAVTIDSNMVYYVGYNNNSECLLAGPSVRPKGEPVVDIVTYSSSGSNVVHDDAYLYFELTFSDYSGLGPSDTPKVILNNSKNEIEYEMIPYYKSVDNTTRKFYLRLDTADLEGGSYDIGIIVEYNDNPVDVPSDSLSIKRFTKLTSIRSILNSVTTTLGFAMISLTALLFAGGVLALGDLLKGVIIAIITVLATLVAATIYLIMLINEDNPERIPGFSIACLFVILALSYGFELGANNWAMAFKKFAESNAKYLRDIYFILFALSMLGMVGLYQQDNPILKVIADAASIVFSLFWMFPVLLAVINLAFALNLLTALMGATKNKGYKYLKWIVRAYFGVLLIMAIIGFSFTANSLIN